jgi:hypothetical protein
MGMGSGGSSGMGGGTFTPLVFTPTGYVQDSTLGITGAWYAYGDGWGTAGPPGNCETKGMFPMTDCSVISWPPAPPPGMPDGGGPGFPQGPAGKGPAQQFCLSGNAAKVIPMSAGTSADYSDLFGIGIGFDFNNIMGNKMVYDTTKYKVIGVQFTLMGSSTLPAGALRVEFPDMETNAACNDSFSDLTATDGKNTIMFSSLVNAFTPPTGCTQPTSFDPTMLLSIQFHVATNTTAAIPVMNLCVSDFGVIVGM